MEATYLGPKGSFSEKAALKAFVESSLIPLPTIRQVIFSVENGLYNYGIVPLENFYNGIVMQTVDCLTECKKTKIIDELYLKVEHCIGALPGHNEIKKIYSHPQALEQCTKYILLNYPKAETIGVESTAKAVEIIKRDQTLDAAAIASKEALGNSNMKIMDEDILPNNSTRFAIISSEKGKDNKKSKTLLSIHPKMDKPGILYNVLKSIAEEKINMKHIHSRPDGKGKYFFILEIEGHENEDNIIDAINKIADYLGDKNSVKVLGSYSDRGK